MKRIRQELLIFLLAGLATTLSSCSSCSTQSSTGGSTSGAAQQVLPGAIPAGIPGLRKTWAIPVPNRPGTVFHVEYSPETAIVDIRTVAKALRGVSADHSIFLFQDSPALRQKLVPGKCVLFEGLDLRKVDALALDGDTLIVGTETAPLTEALKNAQVKFEVPIDFKDIFSQAAAERAGLNEPSRRFQLLDSLAQALDQLDPPVFADTGGVLNGDKEFEDETGAKWKLHFQNAFNADHSLSFNFQLNREGDSDGLNAEIDGQGNLSRFELQNSLLMADGQFKAASYQTTGLHGSVNFNWTLSTSQAHTPMNQARLKLPGSLKFPLVEPLPMTVEISELLLLHPAFTNKNALASDAFSVSYSGDEGFKLSGQNMQTLGAATGDGTISATRAFSPLSAYGAVVAMALPRVELKMGAESLFDAAELPISSDDFSKYLNKLQSLPLVGKMFGQKGRNPLDTEASAYFQVIVSTTAAHSGMLSLVPCEQHTLLVKGQVGVDAKWLGEAQSLPAKDIFTKGETVTKPDNKICGGAATGQ